MASSVLLGPFALMSQCHSFWIVLSVLLMWDVVLRLGRAPVGSSCFLQRLSVEPTICWAVSWACSSQALVALHEDETISRPLHPPQFLCLETLSSSQVSLSFCLHPSALPLLHRLYLWEELLTIQIEVLEVTFLVRAWKASSRDCSPLLSLPSVVVADMGKKVPPGEPSESLQSGKGTRVGIRESSWAWLSSTGSGVRFCKLPERSWQPGSLGAGN